MRAREVITTAHCGSDVVTFGGHPWQRVRTIGESLCGVPYHCLRIQMVPAPGASSLSEGHM
jgi:hypothetical protein